MTDKEYQEIPGVRRSDLYRIISQTPLHFKYCLENPKPDTTALSFGRAIHKYILEPESFDDEYAVLPDIDRRTKAGREAYEQFIEENPGKETLTLEDYRIIVDMSIALHKNPVAVQLLTGEHEKAFSWVDAETGIALKIKTDCLSEFEGKKTIVDYKTTDSCADGAFERAARKYGYKFQAAVYREGVFLNTFEDYQFAFVAQEKTEPYAVRIYICSPGFMAEGLEQYERALALLSYCNRTGDWFGYEGSEKIVAELFGEEEF